MTRHISYPTLGTCSRQIDIELEDGIIRSVTFTGGCHGNTQGIAALVRGMKAADAIARLVPPVEPQPGFMQQYSFIIMIGLMVLVLWLFMWRPESKRRKQMQAFREGLKKGDKIITAGGIYGTVKEIKETTLLIEVDGNVTLRIDKNMVVADNSDLQRQ